MARFPTEYSSKTTPVDTDVVLIADSAASNAVKKVTLSNLLAYIKNGLQAISNLWNTANIVNGAITALKLATDAVETVKIKALAVTFDKIDFTTFQASISYGASSVSGGTNGSTVASTTYSFITGKKYLIISKNRYAAASDGGIWTLQLTVNSVNIADSRLSGVASVQFPSIAQTVYTAAATATYTVAVIASRNSGSGTIAVEFPYILIIPLSN